MSAPVGALNQKLYTSTKHTGMTNSKNTAVREGESIAHGFQESFSIAINLYG
jgi:hypothetical protein